MIRLHTPLYWISLTAAFAFLAGGFGMAGLWLEAGLTLFPVLALGYAVREKASWQGTAGLVGIVGLAGVGLQLHAPASMLIAGSAAGLCAWDLSNFSRLMRANFNADSASRLEIKHLRYLGAALAIGLVLATIGALLPLQMPFIVMIVLIAANLFSLDRLAQFTRKKN